MTLLTSQYGCNDIAPTNLTEYRNWFYRPENGFVKEHQLYDINYQIQYLPYQLLTVNEILKDDSLNLEGINELDSFYKQSSYFMLRFFPDPESVQSRTIDLIEGISIDYADYMEKLEFLNYNLDQSVKLVVDGDTIEPTLFHFERGFDASVVQHAMFAFPISSSDLTSLTVIYDDRIFNTGIQKYQFDVNDLKLPNRPKIA